MNVIKMCQIVERGELFANLMADNLAQRNDISFN